MGNFSIEEKGEGPMLVSNRSFQHVFAQPAFQAMEAKYNVLYAILTGEDALSIHTETGDILLGQTPGYFAWLYIQPELHANRKEELLNALVKYPYSSRLPGVTGDPELIRDFVERYASAYDVTPVVRMELQAYHCPKVIEQEGVRGRMRPAAPGDEQTIARFIVGLNQEAMNQTVKLEDVLERVQVLLPAGHISVWEVDGQVVSLASAAHRSPRHARINMVYTDPAHRGQRYAGALVGGLCRSLLQEGLTPMLYADANYASSNKAYQRVGFTSCGVVTEYRFDAKDDH
ncbi:hypothetical protein SAMN06295960_3023 [Paenibacillus aquistagni]|uniref:N-acetyltransferase domain-containing protein n=2 Tax=Paenibacillus aquistagni TaxID=1852522 RepID=A0A1X7L6P7_9BACL|nr:hypothetical protein SAMN06295960_3023 [Paenibacillus aquistagni]